MPANLTFETISSPKVLTISIAILALLFIITIIQALLLRRKVRKILMGTGAKNLEQSIDATYKDLQELKNFTHEMQQYLTTVETRLRSSVQAVETIRFNPFAGTGSGGNNSFSTAFLNENGKGVTLTSLYSRDRVSIFAKPVEDFSSSFELSDEEKEAIATAKQKMRQ